MSFRYDNAKRIFNKLVKEKMAKGYTPGEDGTPYQTPDDAERFTGILPQLLNPIEEAEVERLLHDDAPHILEQGRAGDGHRVRIKGRIAGHPGGDRAAVGGAAKVHHKLVGRIGSIHFPG